MECSRRSNWRPREDPFGGKPSRSFFCGRKSFHLPGQVRSLVAYRFFLTSCRCDICTPAFVTCMALEDSQSWSLLKPSSRQGLKFTGNHQSYCYGAIEMFTALQLTYNCLVGFLLPSLLRHFSAELETLRLVKVGSFREVELSRRAIESLTLATHV